MSLRLVFVLLVVAALVGIAFGYFLRWIISLGKKGSVELEIKQRIFDANNQAKKILEEGGAKKRFSSLSAEVLDELKQSQIYSEKDFLDYYVVGVEGLRKLGNQASRIITDNHTYLDYYRIGRWSRRIR